jgi:hypothetical protein
MSESWLARGATLLIFIVISALAAETIGTEALA